MTSTWRGGRRGWLCLTVLTVGLLIALGRIISPDMVGAFSADSDDRSSTPAPTPSAAHYTGVLANSQIAAASDSDAAAETRKILPSTFRAHTTQRFVVFSDADPQWALLQAEHLERAAHQFNRVMRRIGLEPQPLRHSLVCVLFDDRNDYVEFAAKHDNVQARWVSGYYSPKHDRIVFYNVASSPDMHDARNEIRFMEEQLKALRDRVHLAEREGNRPHAESLRSQLRDYENHVKREIQRINSYADEVAIATIVHEAIHQLAYHTGIQRSDVQYPIWISEGLATVFETEKPNQAFGPSHDFAPRRERFQAHLNADELLPLNELVQIVSLSEYSPHTVSVIYHQSYALTAWMSRFRRDELRSYLQLKQNAARGSTSPEIHIERFQAAFGNIRRLEHAWLRHERNRGR